MIIRKIVIISWSIKTTQSDTYIDRSRIFCNVKITVISCLLTDTDIAEDDVETHERELYLRDFG